MIIPAGKRKHQVSQGGTKHESIMEDDLFEKIAIGNLPGNLPPIDVTNKESVETGGIVANDVIHWVFDASDDAQIGTLAGADYVEIMAVGEAAAAPDIATDALFGGYELEYV